MSLNPINSLNTNTTALSDSPLLGGTSAAQNTPSSPVSGPQFSAFFERMMHPSFAQDHKNNPPTTSLSAPVLGANLTEVGNTGMLNSTPGSLGGLPFANFLGGTDLSALSGTSAFGDLGHSSQPQAFAPAHNSGFGADSASLGTSSAWGSTSRSPSPPSTHTSVNRSQTHEARTTRADDEHSAPSARRSQSNDNTSTQDNHSRQDANSTSSTNSAATAQSTNAHEHLQRREQSSRPGGEPNPKTSAAVDQDPNAPKPASTLGGISTADSTTPDGVDPLASANTEQPNPAASSRLTLATMALEQQRLQNATSSLPIANASVTSEASSPDSAQNNDSALGTDLSGVDSRGTNALKTVALGNNAQIITASSDAPNEKSLADFARSMGFDEGAISELFGPDANALMLNAAALQAGQLNSSAMNAGALNTVTSAANALANQTSTPGLTLTTNAASLATLTLNSSASANDNTLTAAQTAASAAMLTSNSLGTALNPLSHLPVSGQNGSVLTSPALALNNPIAAALSGNGSSSLLQANASTTLGTNPAITTLSDMSDLMEQAGINTAEAKIAFSAQTMASSRMSGAMASNATNPASTLSVLNMAGSNLSSAAIETLQTAFNQLNGKGAFSTEDSKAFDVGLGATANPAGVDSTPGVVATLDLSGQSTQNGGSNSANSGNPTASNANATSQNPLNMADTYEQLSNQLANELSKRMNDQISQGQWKMKFALKPSSLGIVDISLEMKDGKLAAVLQSDNALTQNLLQHGSQQLKDNLSVLGLNQASVLVGQGSGGGASAQGQGSANDGHNPFANNSQNASSVNDLTQASSTVADAPITGNSNNALLDTFV